ncbi:hypothetical protein BLAT2472_11178 [Burkholderia latens]
MADTIERRDFRLFLQYDTQLTVQNFDPSKLGRLRGVHQFCQQNNGRVYTMNGHGQASKACRAWISCIAHPFRTTGCTLIVRNKP